ncbi:predicted protein [Sclerotinia sclerotiorum 1980 UF-70]|uniref:Uncharacterized protein n=1 Tax=Sclerotinia sclerotiorum (strain ATCC 18683 / 1980 / Ss-1) TaxID=665079 RepID=A7FA52_SCLS1|nr:predicted protein [Sclerotinia sclerotiorum 1980 UF-70]EDO00613.1 predicted protein [Sclerotinia sclerotiorum 1980 UF-70]
MVVRPSKNKVLRGHGLWAKILHGGNDAQLDCICMTASTTVSGTK